MSSTASPLVAPTIRSPNPTGVADCSTETQGRGVATPVMEAVPTREEAHEARRRAAEMGDYALAERWYRCERKLAARDVAIRPV